MRTHFINYKRIVIKLGSSTLIDPLHTDLMESKIKSLAEVLSTLDKEIVIVSSGAQAMGKQMMPSQTLSKQTLASIGQAAIIATYHNAFQANKLTCAQVLLTRYDLKAKRNTFNELLRVGVIPIVNENDVIVSDDIAFGDNDTLAAAITELIDADLLIILSDIDGFYNDDPNQNNDAIRFSTINHIDEQLYQMGKDSSTSPSGTGGMQTKIKAAKRIMALGKEMVLVSGHDLKIIKDILAGKDCGTYFKGK